MMKGPAKCLSTKYLSYCFPPLLLFDSFSYQSNGTSFHLERNNVILAYCRILKLLRLSVHTVEMNCDCCLVAWHTCVVLNNVFCRFPSLLLSCTHNFKAQSLQVAWSLAKGLLATLLKAVYAIMMAALLQTVRFSILPSCG